MQVAVFVAGAGPPSYAGATMRGSAPIAVAGTLILALCAVFPGEARAQTAATALSEAERDALVAGANVVRSQTLERNGRRYIGGLAYAVVAVTPQRLSAILVDAQAMSQILPRTQLVKPMARVGTDTLFELHHGNSLIHAQYTLYVRSEPEQNRMRFWLDPSRPHAVEDAWGFFRYEPFRTPQGDRLLVTYGILVDLGSGLARALYEERVRAMALTVPARLREYVERSGTTLP